jgi:membrane protease YdiL (CAAX protease family)
MVVICILLQPNFSYGMNANKDSLTNRKNIERLSMVVLSGFAETYSIIKISQKMSKPNFPLPYFGIGHFYQGNWSEGIFYLGSEYGMIKLIGYYWDKRGTLNYKIYPNVSTEFVYYPPNTRGYSAKEYKYGSFCNLSYLSLLNIRLIDVYSSYRTFHSKTASTNKVKMNEESIPSLLLSPFKWRYLKNPWVYACPIITGSVAYFITSHDSPLSKAKRVTMFGKQYSPQQAALLTTGIDSYQCTMVAAGEEMYWRGVIQTELTEWTNPNLALIVSSLLFGVWHAPNRGWAIATGASVSGLFLGYRYKSNGYDIGETIASHFWIDFLQNTIEFIRNPKNRHFVYNISWKF